MAKGSLYYYFPSKQDLLFFCEDESHALKRLREDPTNAQFSIPNSYTKKPRTCSVACTFG